MKFLKIIFSISLLPEKKKILLFDTNSIEIMYNINEPFNILYTRGEKFYLWPMIKTLLKFNFSLLGYYKEAIYLLDPKLIITTIDNNFIFYNLKKYFKNKI